MPQICRVECEGKLDRGVFVESLFFGLFLDLFLLSLLTSVLCLSVDGGAELDKGVFALLGNGKNPAKTGAVAVSASGYDPGIYVCVDSCVCVCERERERVCVCVRERVCV